MSEGFSSVLRPDGSPAFKVRLSIEKDPIAHFTLRLRALYRQFAKGRAPGRYYDVIRGQAEPEDLFAKYPAQFGAADRETWNAELGVVSHGEVSSRIAGALAGAKEWMLIGGPPCQAYSVAGRSRNKGVNGYEAESDQRQFLYTEYLKIIAEFWPSAFVMENVKGLLSATVQNQRMFDRILADLESPGRSTRTRSRHRYRIFALTGSQNLFEEAGVSDYVVQAERHGVPQARHRVILVGVRDDIASGAAGSLRLQSTPEVPARCVLNQMPAIRSALSGGVDSPRAWIDAIRSAKGSSWLRAARVTAGTDVRDMIADTALRVRVPRCDRGGEFVSGDYCTAYAADWFYDGRLEGVTNHEAREHMPSDLHRYLFAACFSRHHGYSPKLRHFPDELLPKHDNVTLAVNGHGYFADRFRVQVADRAATTVTSHIAKDGHGFIHPDVKQCRSLSVREAARLQTFPDNYYFAGPRTQQYVQVGNAVPPLLANRIATAVASLLR
ncbi:MAG: DNA cytosine methyltransferase [Vicinamibacterales bacterium]